MDEERYRAIIQAAIETPGIDFKRAMSWERDHDCERSELLKHIAAMSTFGGGVIAIGRDDGDKRTGTMTPEQAATFDVTKVNEYARSYLRPLGSIRVVPVEVDGDSLIILDVPGFGETPPCFQKPSQCKDPRHRAESRHFSAGDLYIRTPAAQTMRLADPDDWRHVWDQIVSNVRNSVSFAEPHEDEMPDPYQLEYQEDTQNHRLPLAVQSQTGVLDVRIKPVVYISDRIPRLRLKPTLAEARAALTNSQSSTPHEMPHSEGASIQNFSKGIHLINQHPEWHRVESAILRSSGSFRLRRIFPEDFNEKNILDGENRRLPLIGLAFDLTLAYAMAARLARSITQGNEMFDVLVSVGGLSGRNVEDDSMTYGARVPISLTIGTGHQGTEFTIDTSRRLTADQLEKTQRDLAIEMYQEILWVFGIEPSSSTVAGFQNAFRQPPDMQQLNG